VEKLINSASDYALALTRTLKNNKEKTKTTATNKKSK
jgi:hypothetical protein